jgi:hypothetical protein
MKVFLEGVRAEEMKLDICVQKQQKKAH